MMSIGVEAVALEKFEYHYAKKKKTINLVWHAAKNSANKRSLRKRLNLKETLVGVRP